MARISTESLDDALSALAAFLEDEMATPEHLVLIGGAALLALGLVSRTTRDVDIKAGVDASVGLVDPRPMSDALQNAAAKVARELDLDPHWLNTGPADQLKAGLPEGFLQRVTSARISSSISLPATI
ncbi:MAG: nucleotidyl transferase AbiEii/AbiGii toxin family protein [Verrucomicrobiota bacterium]